MHGGWRLIWIALLILPGGFPLLFAFLLARAFQKGWQRARAEAPMGPVPLRAAFASVRPRTVLAEARAALH